MDYDALAAENNGTVAPTPIDYDALATQNGGEALQQSSALGAAARGFELGVVPMATAIPGIGAGVAAGELTGGVIGGAIGSVVPVAGTAAGAAIGSTIGGFVGGMAGGFAGGMVGAEAQDLALKQLPDSFRKTLGIDQAQLQVDQEKHPYAAQIGGLAPFLFTARPWAAPGVTKAADTAIGRFMGDWRTQKAAGGAIMGAWELGQEALNKDEVDWTKVAVATAFGAVFNHQNKAGQRLMQVGEMPFEPRLTQSRALRAAAANEAGQPRSVTAGLFSDRYVEPGLFSVREMDPELFNPTLREISASGVMGPGNTEKTFQGLQERNPVADGVSRMLVEDEQSMLYGPQLPDEGQVGAFARRLDPELFDYRDELMSMADEARAAIDNYRKPSFDEYNDLRSQRSDLQSQLAETKNKNEQRRIKTQIRLLTEDIDSTWSRMSGEGQLDETLTNHYRELAAVNQRLREIGPEVAAVHRRAAEGLGRGDLIMEVKPFEEAPPVSADTPGVAPELFTAAKGAEAPSAAPTSMTQAMSASGARVDIAAEKAKIIADRKRQMIEAGRPADEAQADAEMIANRFVARAGWFNGQLGSPYELYLAKSAKITKWEPSASPTDRNKVAAKSAAPAEQVTQDAASAQETMQIARQRAQDALGTPGQQVEGPFSPEPTEGSVESPSTLPGEAAPITPPTAEAQPVVQAEITLAPQEPAGPKVGDKITMNGTSYKIAEIDDNRVRLQPTKKGASEIILPRQAVDQMLGEHLADTVKPEGEKITLNGQDIDPKLAAVIRKKLAEQEAPITPPLSASSDRAPDTSEMAALRERMRQEAMSDEYPVVSENPVEPNISVNGEFELRHGLQKDAAANFDKTGKYEFVEDYKGERYDGEGDASVFGNAIYLDNTGIWTNDKGRGMGLWAINKSVRVSYKPKNALLLTPDTMATVRSKIGLDKNAVLTPEIVRDYAKANGNDSIIIQGFEHLVGDAEERYAKKYGVPNLPDNWKTNADRIPWEKLDKADRELLLRRVKQQYDLRPGAVDLEERIARIKEYGANLYQLSDAEVHTKGRLTDEVAQDQVVVYDKSIVKVLGEAPADEKFAGHKFEATREPPRLEVTKAEPENPPLIPTAEKPIIASENKNSANQLEAIDATDLNVDAKRFQFKSGGDEKGVIDTLKGVSEWDPMLADNITVWQDKNGKYWVADGHQRSGLARRLMENGHEPIKLNAWVLKESNGVTDAQARVIAAIKNINQGTGTSIDAAKIIREVAEVKGVKLPQFAPNSKLAKEGKALANLSPEAFGMVINEVVPTNYGAVVGRLVKDPLQQQEAIRVIAKVKDKINVNQAEIIVKDMLAQGTEMATETGSLFGDEAFASSVVLERAQIVDEAIKLLKSDKKVFKTLVSDSDRIMGHGSNVLDVEANKGRLTEDERVQEYVEKLATRAGPISDALTEVAKKYKAGEISRAAASRGFIESVKRGAGEGVAYGNDTLGAKPSAAGSSETKYEPGVEGLDQGLIPGVNPVTDKERMAVQAEKPLQGGNQEPGGLFDQGSQDQESLFQRSGKGKQEAALGAYLKRAKEIWLKPNANPSTIIHENGHDFLEQLKEDAAHDMAPDQLRADFDTVKNWVGWKDGQVDFTVKQHEKFARGFERYFYDGIAPSNELAAVFQRFSNWLRQAYQSVVGLNKPNAIPEEIRAVFDRLLTNDPSRVTVAREVERPRSVADIHETDAVTADAAQAAPMADRVQAERVRTVLELPKEIRNELAAAADRAGFGESEAGISTRFGNAGGMAEDFGGSVTVAPGSSRSANDGAVSESRSEVTKESTGAPSGDGVGVVPRATVRFGERAGGQFVDKAGNIRLENLTTQESLKAAIREIAYGNDGFIEARRGVISDVEGLSLAEQIGMDGAENLVNDWVKGQAFNHEEIMALRLLIRESAADLFNKAEAVKNSGDWQTARDYAIAEERHIAIQKTLSGVTAEWGRAGRAFRDISGDMKVKAVEKLFRQNTGSTLYQITERANLLTALDSEQAVSRFVRNSQKTGFARWIQEYWINGLISGVSTHSTYMVANEMLALWKAIPETLTSATVSELARMRGKEVSASERVRFGEAWAQILGAKEGFAPALKAAKGSIKTGVTTLLPGETMRTLPGLQPGQESIKPEALDAAYTLRQIMPDTFALMRSSREAIMAYGEALKNGINGETGLGLKYSPLGSIPDVTFKGVRVAPVGTILRTPGRSIQGIHAFHRVQMYFMEINAEAFRKASAELEQGVIKPEQFAQRVSELKLNPDTEMMKRASTGATEGTMMAQGGAWTRKLSALINHTVETGPFRGVQPLKFIDPFIHIASNIINESILKRTPVGLLSEELRADLAGRNGNLAQEKAIGRMMLGTTVMIGVIGAVKEGFITGGEPSDPAEAAEWRKLHQAYSVKLGDQWYSYHRLGVLGLLMGIAADLTSVTDKLAREELTEAASALTEAFYHNIFEESFLRGPAELFRAIENHERYGPQYIRNFLSSFVPFSVGMSQWARTADPYSRRARTLTDAIKQKIPYVSQELPVRRDLWGEPIRNPTPLYIGGAVPSAIHTFQPSTDPVDMEMERVGVKKAQVDDKIRNVDLTEQQYDDFQRIAGRLTKMQLDTMVRSPKWNQLPDEVKRLRIEETFDHQREAARNLMMMKYKQIPRDAQALRMGKLMPRPSAP